MVANTLQSSGWRKWQMRDKAKKQRALGYDKGTQIMAKAGKAY